MAYDESVDQVLRKISHHNSDIFGCLATCEDRVYSSLPEIYDLIDVEAVVEYAHNMFAITEMLETVEETFDEVFLEFQGHSFVIRKLRVGLLILVSKPIKRGAFRKMQLGMTLFLKPLERVLLSASAQKPVAVPRKSLSGARGLRRVFGNLV